MTIIASPDEGYELSKLAVTDKSGSEVTLKDNGDGTFTFTMPAKEVTVNGEFAVKAPKNHEDVCKSKNFSDLDLDAWYHDAIDFVLDNGMMNGIDTTFAPNDNTTRGMLMTMPARMNGVDTNGGSAWYEKGMEWAVANGISDGSNPSGLVTREQLATMRYRMAGSPSADADLNAYPGGDNVFSWATDAMKWAVANGIIKGGSYGLNPQGKASRVEVAQILMNYSK